MSPKYKNSVFSAVGMQFALGACVAFMLGSGIVRSSADETALPVLSDKPDMIWFTDARLGIFIHWGIYSEGNGSESWAFHSGETPYETYTRSEEHTSELQSL